MKIMWGFGGDKEVEALSWELWVDKQVTLYFMYFIKLQTYFELCVNLGLYKISFNSWCDTWTVSHFIDGDILPSTTYTSLGWSNLI